MIIVHCGQPVHLEVGVERMPALVDHRTGDQMARILRTLAWTARWSGGRSMLVVGLRWWAHLADAFDLLVNCEETADLNRNVGRSFEPTHWIESKQDGKRDRVANDDFRNFSKWDSQIWLVSRSFCFQQQDRVTDLSLWLTSLSTVASLDLSPQFRAPEFKLSAPFYRRPWCYSIKWRTK